MSNLAIIYTAGGNYIGEVQDEKEGSIVLNPAFIWMNEQMMVNTGHPSNPQPQMVNIRQPAPLNTDIESTKITITNYVAVQYLNDWTESARSEVEDQINGITNMMETQDQERRARKAGIDLSSSGTSSEELRQLLSQK